MSKRRAKAMFYRRWKNSVLDVRGRDGCNECGGKILYFMRYDADFCPRCNLWITHNCNDLKCDYCVGRPESPEEALALDKILLANEYQSVNHGKERAIRSYEANERHKVRRTRKQPHNSQTQH